MPIPKIIWTIWLGGEMPEWIKECVATHDIPGYEHRLITDANTVMFHKYVQDCIESRKYAKAADFLRIWYLEQKGGIYLDADVKVIEGKNFNDLLDLEMFVGEEENGFVSNAIIGSRAHHPILQDYLGKVQRNFIGSGDLVFQPGMFLWTEIVKYSLGVKIFAPDVFLPYNHHMDRLLLTENSRTIHYFNKSWITNTK